MRGQSVLHWAARRGEVDVLTYLFEDNLASLTDFLLEDWNGQTPYECIPRVDSGGNNLGTREFFKTKILVDIVKK